MNPPLKARGLCINLTRIQSEKTLQYLQEKKINDEFGLQSILPMCHLEGVTCGFHQHIRSYTLPFDAEKVWDAYLHIPPKMCWAGNHIDFSFAYNPMKRAFHYRGDAYKGLEESQLYFIEIRLFFGLFRLAVTHQVNEISHEKKSIKLCYVEGGKSEGSQYVEIKPVSAHECIVTHKTWYKSDSEFRDKRLYPILHGFIINQFHRNVKNYIRTQLK